MEPKSNVTLLPNVHLRAECNVREDVRFQQQVRGREALLRLLRMVEPGGHVESAARRYLTGWQRAELGWQTRCAECNAYPFGPVRRKGVRHLEFRCPRRVCPASSTTTRSLRLNQTVVEEVTARMDLPAIHAITKLLQDRDIRPAGAYVQDREELCYYPVRLSWTQYYSLSDEDVEAELKRILREERHG
jgi:hypothetical protein